VRCWSFWGWHERVRHASLDSVGHGAGLMDRILISACLVGRPVRWNGKAKTLGGDWIARWQEEGRLVPACPELLGGLPVPRAPAEIEPGGDAEAVWSGQARILEPNGRDVTGQFLDGAVATLALAEKEGCRFALLTQASPSCGVGLVHDGHFAGVRIAGFGVAASLLQARGLLVFPEERVEDLATALSMAG